MRPASSPRKVIVDDNDPCVHYTGPWYSTNGQDYHANGGVGEPYCDTMHGTTGKASFSYSFIGSTGQVKGNAEISNSSSVMNPSWECVLDGVSIPVNDPPKSPTVDWSFCEWNSTIGSHTVTVNVDGHGKNFWFDQLIYVPDPEIVFKNATVLVTHTDAALMYDSGWLPPESDSRMANGGGSVVTFPFFGNGLSWFGKIPGGKHQRPMAGSFSIDDQPPINFMAVGQRGRPGSRNTKSLQLFFKTPPLPQSTHTLTVTSQSGPMPLSLAHLVLNNAELPVRFDVVPAQTVTISAASTITASLSTTSTSIQPSSTKVGGQHMLQFGHQGSQNGPPKAIIGGVVGGIVLCFLVFALFIRRRRRTKLESAESAFAPPPPYTPPQSMSQVSGSQEYPSALPVESSRNHFSNFTKRFTSISTRPNSLFQTARLSVLPVKRPPSLASSASSRTYRPYVSRPRSNTRSSTGSTATLLPSAPPSRKTSMISFRDDQPVVLEHKDGDG